jgi:hypothetical protein
MNVCPEEGVDAEERKKPGRQWKELRLEINA